MSKPPAWTKRSRWMPRLHPAEDGEPSERCTHAIDRRRGRPAVSYPSGVEGFAVEPGRDEAVSPQRFDHVCHVGRLGFVVGIDERDERPIRHGHADVACVRLTLHLSCVDDTQTRHQRGERVRECRRAVHRSVVRDDHFPRSGPGLRGQRREHGWQHISGVPRRDNHAQLDGLPRPTSLGHLPRSTPNAARGRRTVHARLDPAPRDLDESISDIRRVERRKVIEGGAR